MSQEFVQVRTPAFHEFRIQRVNTRSSTLWWSLAIAVVALGIRHLRVSHWEYWSFAIVLTWLFRYLNTLISESIIVFPSHGIQLEARYTLRTTRHFIPLSALRDVVINEGLHGWNVRYYLAIATEDPFGCQRIQVAFPDLLPRFPVLSQVYNEIHDLLDVI